MWPLKPIIYWKEKTAIAREIIFFNIGFFMLFRMLPDSKIRVRSLKKIKNKFFENRKFDIKQKRISES